jgi:hypothetical protein
MQDVEEERYASIYIEKRAKARRPGTRSDDCVPTLALNEAVR